MAVITKSGAVLTGEEVKFLNRDEDRYPQLMRLALDFDLRVLCITPSNPKKLESFLITYNTYQHKNTPAISPEFTSLGALEQFANDNIVDILHDALIEPSDEPAL